MAAKPKSKGREQRRSSAVAKAHTPSLAHFYRYRLPPITPGEFEFHLDLLRPGLPPLSLDRMVEVFNWVDEQSVMTGSMTLHRPDAGDSSSLPIARGHRVRCRVRWAGGLFDLWTMRVDPPQTEVDQGTVELTLQDDMVLLEAGRREWVFRKTRQRPFGYTCDEVGQAVARAIGISAGTLAGGTTRFAMTMRKATPLDVLRAAYAKEKKASGRSFVIRLRNGKLEVVPLQRNPLIYVLAHQIQTALITQKAGVSQPTTILTGRGRLGHGKGTQKIAYTNHDRKVVKLLGAVRETKDYGRVGSHGELRAKVDRDLAAGLRANDTIEVTHQGVPFIVRGDGVQVLLPSEGYAGAQSFVYATSANHTVQSGVYTSTWMFTLADPYLGKLSAFTKAAAARSTKRKRRTRSKLRTG